MPDHQEVTSAMNSVLRWARRSTGELVGSIRRQAPAARMIGEFAVKHVAREAGKRMPGSPGATAANNDAAAATNDPAPEATAPAPDQHP